MKNIYYALLRDGLVHEIAETYLYEYLEEVAQKLEYDYVLDEVNEPLKVNSYYRFKKDYYNGVNYNYFLILERENGELVPDSVRIVDLDGLKELTESVFGSIEDTKKTSEEYTFIPPIAHFKNKKTLTDIDRKELVRVNKNYINQLKGEQAANYQDLEELEEVFIPKVKGNNRSKHFRKLEEKKIDVDYKRYKNKRNKKRNNKYKQEVENKDEFEE